MDYKVYLIFGVYVALLLGNLAQAFCAYRLGDTTQKEKGHLTLNPLKHFELLGSVLVPGVFLVAYILGWNNNGYFFLWAKGVQLDVDLLKNIRRDVMFISVACPLAILLFALVLFGIHFVVPENIRDILTPIFVAQLIVGVINLLPIPPLPGSKLITYWLPIEWELFICKHSTILALVFLTVLLLWGQGLMGSIVRGVLDLMPSGG